MIFIKLLFILFISVEPIQKRYISIPFTIQIPDSKEILDSQTFLQNYFTRNIIFDFSIGQNSQKVNGIINQDDECFEFIDEKNFSFSNINSYLPKISNSFKIRNEIIYESYKDDQYLAIGSDYFNFEKNEKYNISFLFIKTTNRNDINFEEIKNKKYLAKIGLVLPSREGRLKNECPYFFPDTKTIGNLSKYIISFEFNDNYNGNLIFGDELYNYNKDKYHESQYVGSYASDHHQTYFSNVFINKNNKKINATTIGTFCTFVYNSGIIIGIGEFRKNINENFFNQLFSENICESNLIKYNDINYYVYSCEEEKFKNKIKDFPKIIFESTGFKYNFELNYDDLFLKLGSKYYFLMIFKENDNRNEWKFGQPFYRKFKLTINLDDNWIGLYNPNNPIIEKNTGNDDNNDGNKTRNIILIIALVIFVIGLAVGMFFLGRKLRNDRKKRANELMDDNYDYSAGINA